MVAFIFPGQGSQKIGMGEGLFEKFSDITAKADEVLGYSIAEFCLKDPKGQISKTEFTQPALYTVNVLTYLDKINGDGKKPAYVAGHSLGEYSALFAAGCFDFETGLKLVQKRGALMGEVSGSGMAAVVGKTGSKVAEILKENQLDTVDIANYNTLNNVVISGNKDDVVRARAPLEAAGYLVFPLNVSGAFHSRYMTPARDEFEGFIQQFEFMAPQIPVIANYTGRPYGDDEVKTNLVEQINHSVRWLDSIQYLLDQGENEFVEIGPGKTLGRLVDKIKNKQ